MTAPETLLAERLRRARWFAGGLVAVMALVSMARPGPPDRSAARFHWSDMKPDTAGTAWYRDYRVQAAALAILMVVFIAAFW